MLMSNSFFLLLLFYNVISGLSCDTSTTSVTTFGPYLSYSFAAFDTGVEKYIKFGVRAQHSAMLSLAASTGTDQDNVYVIGRSSL